MKQNKKIKQNKGCTISKPIEENYEQKLKFTTEYALHILDSELSRVEAEGKTGSQYWKRLRVRKRIIQNLLKFANYEKEKIVPAIKLDFLKEVLK